MAETLSRVRREPRRGPQRRRSWTVTLTGERRDPSVIRAGTRRMLAAVDPAVADDVLVVASELVTNAVLHGRDPVVVTVTLELPDVIISVTDRGAADPTPRPTGEEDEAGRGLQIIQRLTTHWHVEHGEGTKSVVAVVQATPARR
jgi:anti-sigma regulatory factor (Ser/Thr protein kinase)